MSFTIPSDFFHIASDDLRGALLGAYVQHGLISTRKAVAALRYNRRIYLALERMHNTETIPGDQNSSPLVGEALNRVLTSVLYGTGEGKPVAVPCSPCVYNAAHACLQRFAKEEIGFGKVDEEKFVLILMEVSVGPTAQRWKSDGYTPEKFKLMMEAEGRGAEGSEWRSREGRRYD